MKTAKHGHFGGIPQPRSPMIGSIQFESFSGNRAAKKRKKDWEE